MQQKNGLVKIEYLGWITLLLSIVFSFILIGTNAFPYLGLTFTIITLTLVIFYFKNDKSLSIILLTVAITILATFLTLRTNTFLINLNLVTILFLLGLLIHHSQKRRWYALSLFTSPFQIFEALFSTRNTLSLPLHKTKDIKIDNDLIKKASISSVITILTLLIIVPLLSYSNPIFKSYIAAFFDLFDFDLSWILNFIFSGTLITRALVTVCFYFLISRAISFLLSKEVKKPIILHNSLKNYLSITKIIVITSNILRICFFECRYRGSPIYHSFKNLFFAKIWKFINGITIKPSCMLPGC